MLPSLIVVFRFVIVVVGQDVTCKSDFDSACVAAASNESPVEDSLAMLQTFVQMHTDERLIGKQRQYDLNGQNNIEWEPKSKNSLEAQPIQPGLQHYPAVNRPPLTLQQLLPRFEVDQQMGYPAASLSTPHLDHATQIASQGDQAVKIAQPGAGVASQQPTAVHGRSNKSSTVQALKANDFAASSEPTVAHNKWYQHCIIVGCVFSTCLLGVLAYSLWLKETVVISVFKPACSKTSIMFSFFVILGSAHNLMPHFGHDMNYNFLCPIVITSVLKIVGSIALHVYEDGRGMSEVLQTFRDEYTVFLKYGLPSALFGVYDVLSFVNLSIIDPSTYVVVMQFKLVVTGILWEFSFWKPMSQWKRFAVLLITIGCCCKEVCSKQTMSGHWSVLILLFVQVLAGCAATINNEILLKKEMQVSTNLQNVAQYVWTLVLAIFIGLVCIPMKVERLSLNPLDLHEWAKMTDVRMLPSLVVLSVNGLVVARILRDLDSLWKAIGDVMKIFVCAGASWLIWGYPITFTDWFSLSVIAFGIVLFNQG